MLLPEQAQIGLMYQRGGLQGVIGTLGGQQAPRHPPQFLVQNRRHFVQRGLISVAPVHQQLCEILWLGHYFSPDSIRSPNVSRITF